MNQTKCKKCGSDKVRLSEHLPLYIPDTDRVTNEKELYQWDEEIYAQATCDNCKFTYPVQGDIKWKV